VSGIIRGQLHIKRPILLGFNNGEEAKLLPQLLLRKSEVLQFLQQIPYPNITGFNGCTVNRGQFTGIALGKHSLILRYCHEDVSHPLNIDSCMSSIRTAVRHLHSFGLAHNDPNSTKIPIDRDYNSILLDFGSFRRFSQGILSGGTTGWIDEDCSTSAQCHDELALGVYKGNIGKDFILNKCRADSSNLSRSLVFKSTIVLVVKSLDKVQYYAFQKAY